MVVLQHRSPVRQNERESRQFYQRFTDEHLLLQAAIEGLENETDRQQYATLLMNRLMFLYFLQQKGFLDNDRQYLAHRLACMPQAEHFYHDFFLRLCHEGLSQPIRTPEVRQLLGVVPYLDGMLFRQHALEYTNPLLYVSASTFQRIFTFLDAYHWQLDAPSIPTPHMITPDVLGYIFEQHINQYELGAYYTHQDVTAYLARNTIIPHLLHSLAQFSTAPFRPNSTLWQLLSTYPERYIYEPVRHPALLPGETSTEYSQRQERATLLQQRLYEKQIQSIDELISENLDIARFVLDVIDQLTSEELDLFYQKLTQISVLDPTCGSGAFLLAALTVLEPLYAACLVRMEQRSDSYARQILASYDRSPGRSYQIRHTILANNIYGVDIMHEAIEICALRLSLALMAHVHTIEELQPLPLFPHLQSGNVLIGEISVAAQLPTQAQLDRVTARDFGIGEDDEEQFNRWRVQARPFHWVLAYPDVLRRGGFDVMIGNPPYVEYEEKTFPYTLRGYQTLSCANLYPCIIERSRQLLSPHGWQGMILPLASFATRKMRPFIDGFYRWFACSWLSFYHFRPSMLFSGSKVASIPIAIYLARVEGKQQRFSTHLLKWSRGQRAQLFSLLSYTAVTVERDEANLHYYPKFGRPCENAILEKIHAQRCVQHTIIHTTSANTMYYRSAGGLYWKVFINFPWPYTTTSNKQCSFQEGYDRDVFVALFNSSLFWWYYTITFDSFNVKDYMLFGFRFTYPQRQETVDALKMLCQHLMADFQRHARHLKRGATDSYTLYARKSKGIIDEIDRVLAEHYGLTEEEYLFIINYDLKYRLGLEPNV